MHRNGARPVRRGGVGALGQPRPGLLPDKEHRCLRSTRREACEMHRAVPARKPAASAVAGTGKRNATKAARCVWGGADGKGLVTAPRRRPTLLGGGADGKGSQDTSPAAYSTWRRGRRKRVARYLAGGLLYSKGEGTAATLFPLPNRWKRPGCTGTSLAAYPTSRPVLKAGGRRRLLSPS